MSSLKIEKAERVKKFIEKYCSFSKGEWAGQLFKLLPWEWDDIIKPLFGTIKNGVRQYRTCYVEIPKKNGKSELCAAIGLYMLTNDGEDGAVSNILGIRSLVGSENARNHFHKPGVRLKTTSGAE